MASDDHALSPWLEKLTKQTPLGRDDCAALLGLPHRMVAVDSDTYLVRAGEKARNCCVLLTGFAYRSRSTAAGLRQILAINMRGDAVDLQNSMMQVSDHSVQTLTQAELAFIPHQAMLHLIAKYPRVGEALWRQTLIEGSIANEWIVNIGRRDGRQRVSHFICELAFLQKLSGLTDGPEYCWPLTMEQMADATALTAVHVSRVVQGLRSEGLVGTAHQTLTIPNWDALRDAGGFSSAYLHQDQFAA